MYKVLITTSSWRCDSYPVVSGVHSGSIVVDFPDEVQADSAVTNAVNNTDNTFKVKVSAVRLN